LKILIVTCSLKGEIVSQHAFTKDRVVLGRGAECDVVLENPGISRQHAEIIRDEEGGFILKDLGSQNGTLLNKKRVKEAALGESDVLSIGKFLLNTKVTSQSPSDKEQVQGETPWQRDPTIRAKA
jgi:pSer/pThr/pTyr-binding forkhead associated (FHA) protein